MVISKLDAEEARNMKGAYALLWLATAALVATAWTKEEKFYPTCVYLSKSPVGTLIASAHLTFVFYIAWKFFRNLFYEELGMEIDDIDYRIMVLEASTPFAAFGTKFTPKFLGLFLMFLLMKGAHYVAEVRVLHLERSPSMSLRYHLRTLFLTLLLMRIDHWLMGWAYSSLSKERPSWHLGVIVESSILLITIYTLALKYLLNMCEIYRVLPWDEKSMLVLYGEAASLTAKLCAYAFCLTVSVTHNFYPVILARPVNDTVRGLIRTWGAIRRSRIAIRNMHAYFPTATQSELTVFDDVCTICRENMSGDDRPKLLPCGHIFHAHCLTIWFMVQQNCPICRTDILRRPIDQ